MKTKISKRGDKLQLAKDTDTKQESVHLNTGYWSMARKIGFVMAPLLLSVVLVVFLNLPAPSFSQSVKDWRDSGFMFKFENFSIFYQDIFSLRPYRKEPVLLILHGFPTSSYDWKKVIFDLLSPFGRIIAPDMIGLGFSDKKRNHNYSLYEQATMHEELLHHLNITRVHLLGHDIGVTVAQELMARYEERRSRNVTGLMIQSLCMANGAALPEVHNPRLIQKLLRIKWIGDILASLVSFPVFKTSFGEVFGHKSQPSKSEFEDFWTIIRWNDGHLGASRFLRYISERFENRDRWVGALQKTSVPLHLIFGTGDPVIPEPELTAYKRSLPNLTVHVLKEVGHYPHWENPSGFLRGYFTFAQRLGLRR